MRRRLAIQAAAALTALPVLGQHEHGSTMPSVTYKPRWATADEMRVLGEFCELIIPKTNTPGALDARVPEYIDFHAASSEGRKKAIRAAIAWFKALPSAQRVVALTKASRNLESREGKHFQLIKDLTIDGYYSSREGLVQELGWNANTYVADYKGCTEPEHGG